MPDMIPVNNPLDVPIPVPKTLDDVCDLLQQIIDLISNTNNQGVVLGGTNANADAGKSVRMVGQRVSSGLSSDIHGT